MDFTASDVKLAKGGARVRRTVTLGQLSFEALGGSAGRHQDVVGRSLTMAIKHYLAGPEQGRPRVPPPALRMTGASAVTEVEFSIEEKVWSELTREAAKEQVTARDLLRHAVLVFIADRDAGRIYRPKRQELWSEALS